MMGESPLELETSWSWSTAQGARHSAPQDPCGRALGTQVPEFWVSSPRSHPTHTILYHLFCSLPPEVLRLLQEAVGKRRDGVEGGQWGVSVESALRLYSQPQGLQGEGSTSAGSDWCLDGPSLSAPASVVSSASTPTLRPVNPHTQTLTWLSSWQPPGGDLVNPNPRNPKPSYRSPQWSSSDPTVPRLLTSLVPHWFLEGRA